MIEYRIASGTVHIICQIRHFRALRLYSFQNLLLLRNQLLGIVDDGRNPPLQGPMTDIHRSIDIQAGSEYGEQNHHDQPGDLGSSIVIAVDQNYDHDQIEQGRQSQIVRCQLSEFVKYTKQK